MIKNNRHSFLQILTYLQLLFKFSHQRQTTLSVWDVLWNGVLSLQCHVGQSQILGNYAPLKVSHQRLSLEATFCCSSSNLRIVLYYTSS